MRVPDERIDILSDIFKPKKTIFAEIRMQEIPWTGAEGSNRRSAAEKYVKCLAGAELLIHVVRAFENPYLADSVDPKRDLSKLDQEMILADLVACENVLERHKKRPAEPNVLEAVKKAKDALEQERFLSTVPLSDDEKKHLGGFGLSTMMNQMILINTAENELLSQFDNDFRTILTVPLGLAKEVSELPPEEQIDFLADVGLTEPLVNHITREIYSMMNLISFFTVGEDEVRAWTIPANTVAQKAAGKIHTDLERGFIRAEVVDYKTFMGTKSLKACKEAGTLRIEGKNYIVQDGDIINVRFNV